MKRITAILLIVVISLFSTGIITSCSCNGSGNVDVQKTDFSTNEALEATVKWLTETYTHGDKSIVEKYLDYKILPASTNSPCFVRYTLSSISARDLLVFKDGKVIVIDDDSLAEVQGYNHLFSVDITKVTNAELMAQSKCVSGTLKK